MATPEIIIAIDGYSSSGKSTMARDLAAEIGYRYIDSGAMYRAVTLYALRHNLINTEGVVDTEALNKVLKDINIDFRIEDGKQLTTLDGEVVENEIRRMEVSNLVSFIAAIPEVRHDLVAKQQALGARKGIVMDGRDIGTTVFPDAEMKIFVDASPETRAMRRYKELAEKGVAATYEEILANVVKRDNLDRTRKESPLRCADDAIRIDNSDMTRQQQNRLLLDIYHKIVDNK